MISSIILITLMEETIHKLDNICFLLFSSIIQHFKNISLVFIYCTVYSKVLNLFLKMIFCC